MYSICSVFSIFFFFFNDTATTEIYTLSLPDALPIRACQAGHRVLFATASEWVARLADAHHAGRLQGELIRLGRYPLLVIDLCRPRDYAEGLCCPAPTDLMTW